MERLNNYLITRHNMPLGTSDRFLHVFSSQLIVLKPQYLTCLSLFFFGRVGGVGFGIKQDGRDQD